MKAPAALTRRQPLARSAPISRNAPLRAVSAKRQQQNRERRAMKDRRWPHGERPRCANPRCPGPNLADDLHEIRTRARGGSITDPVNTIPLCRRCNRDLAQLPESGLQWAYDLGLLAHSWDAGRPG